MSEHNRTSCHRANVTTFFYTGTPVKDMRASSSRGCLLGGGMFSRYAKGARRPPFPDGDRGLGRSGIVVRCCCGIGLLRGEVLCRLGSMAAGL